MQRSFGSFVPLRLNPSSSSSHSATPPLLTPSIFSRISWSSKPKSLSMSPTWVLSRSTTWSGATSVTLARRPATGSRIWAFIRQIRTGRIPCQYRRMGITYSGMLGSSRWRNRILTRVTATRLSLRVVTTIPRTSTITWCRGMVWLMKIKISVMLIRFPMGGWIPRWMVSSVSSAGRSGELVARAICRFVDFLSTNARYDRFTETANDFL